MPIISVQIMKIIDEREMQKQTKNQQKNQQKQGGDKSYSQRVGLNGLVLHSSYVFSN